MFMFYYVKIYLNIFHVPQMWFNIAQTLFMFWNAVNDPLFGYMQVHFASSALFHICPCEHSNIAWLRVASNWQCD